ncbi:lasso peptide biosynthesis B2 protein [Phenylobacterium sp.]|uniref:lasso peptide biosynthesis B2 protein n=1 Tax=Phenylobacterium sp. TaxID=1871053 RepID=UPI0035AEA9E7
MRLVLAAHCHAVEIQGDLVLLDARGGTYLCLAGRTLATLPSDRAAVDRLRAAGLVEQGTGTDRPPACGAPRAACDLPDGPVTPMGPGVLLDLIIAYGQASWAFAWGRFAQIVRPQGADAALEDREALLADVRFFLRWLPWLPFQGRCLKRSFLLRSFLVWRGRAAPTWVFGVATYPFAAHCWLQWGDCVLDERVGRLARYAPILVVD